MNAKTKKHPVSHVRWVKRERVHANDYNPNSVAPRELELLKISVKSDGYTQPVVCVADDDDTFAIVDGFHRWLIMEDPEIAKMTGGELPIVVLDKPINDRMAATVRHNRERGTHSITGMSKIVYEMLRNGATDDEVIHALGLSVYELERLKHITGYAKLYKDHEYSRAWLKSEKASYFRKG